MQPELRDLGDAASLVVERLATPVQGMHRVISDRVFRYVGPPGAPVKAVYDTIVGGVYQGIRRGSRIVGSGVGAMLATRSPAPNPISESRAGSGVQAALNAVWGDQLDERENRLAVGLSVRAGGRALTVDGASLAAAYPNAGRHVVVLLHGLGQTERCWQSSHPDGSGFFETLAVSPGVSPVLVRYNSGLPVDRSGEDLSHLLGELVENWPVPDIRVSLVGYSMGGLVARRAYAAGVAAGDAWTGTTGDLISVGAPHHGSPVARGVRLGSWALGIAKTSRPLGDFLETASAGIKDLRDGAGVAEAWAELVTSSPADSAGIRQHFVAAVVTGDVRHPIGVLVGDLVVRVASATGPAIAPSNVHILSRRRHFDILSDVEVTNQILDWLGVATPGN